MPDTRHRVLWSAGTWNIGESYDEGLPNIVGAEAGVVSNSVTPTGAFQKETRVSYFTGGTSASNRYTDFDASRSNSIYGASETVRPRCIVVEMMIKY